MLYIQIMSYEKPFIKWVGGKTQIIDKIIKYVPSEINNYHEIFLGGGSVLLAILSLRKSGQIKINGDIYAYDINKVLIGLYKNVQRDPLALHNALQKYITGYNMAKDKKEYYYKVRDTFNTPQIANVGCELSAMFIFLNKTGFRGLYREGPNGYNVSYGHYKNPLFPSQTQLQRISELIQDVHFKCLSYVDSLSCQYDHDDFIYMDPPYVPENAKSFVRYSNNGFALEDHIKLFNMIKRMQCKFAMSNSNMPLVIEQFADHIKEELNARRAINSKNPSMTTKEIIISHAKK